MILNHQSLIATKSNRIVRAARGRPSPVGSRRGGGRRRRCWGPAPPISPGVPAPPTRWLTEYTAPLPAALMAHSWVQMFPDRYTAFKTYCELYPHSATLLVDTYNVLKSGVPNAIRAFQEVLLPQGIHDSPSVWTPAISPTCPRRPAGCWTPPDFKAARSWLPIPWTSIHSGTFCSRAPKSDSFGVGERLITSKSEAGLRRGL